MLAGMKIPPRILFTKYAILFGLQCHRERMFPIMCQRYYSKSLGKKDKK